LPSYERLLLTKVCFAGSDTQSSPSSQLSHQNFVTLETARTIDSWVILPTASSLLM
jgi:hypothetical protein